MKKIFLQAAVIILFITCLFILVGFARGYRLDYINKKVVPTGILIATSTPDGAKIFINGTLRGATNQNISLPPGNYTVEISKDGYTTWKSDVLVRGEVVSRADATLFPLNPSLTPVTSLGILHAEYFANANKVAIITDNPENATSSESLNGDVEKNGLYILDTTKKPLSLFNPLKLIIGKSKFPNLDSLIDTQSIVSPDGKELLFTVNAKAKFPITYLVTTDETSINLFDTSRSKSTIITAWHEKEVKQTDKILETFKKPFYELAKNYFEIVYFSPDETKVLYRAKANVNIPIVIKPRLIGSNQADESRDIVSNNLYIYDKKEDRNFLIGNISELPQQNIFWYPDSLHLIIKEKKQISTINYDGTHKQTVYSGPFEQNFVGVTQDGKLLILANLNPQKNNLPDLYAVGIR
ncbi:hypothetical protein A3H78_01110 [Candidatus Roizmanbacteria bacterium RIFCSPLOWO2_02_FULL_36_11]|uniref:PEGA domain-containing protein n=1 Tax=Candidatus Roizmanbacteria bacterium RIFCSPLOWO2_02_FULL_36_11 TaxID=1802071 RepID=A0A1F7JIN0_9BACT|nr:MAG: hypothetical protein A3H78_01110 [Candidatus Roizmanbacteria bacterium RIFCSPLOWO2_02_FULL_36_11]